MCFLTLVFQTDPGVISLWCSGQTEYFQDSSQDAVEAQETSWMTKTYWRTCYYSAVYEDKLMQLSILMYELYTLMIVSNKLFRFLLNKICYYLLYIVPLRCEILYCVFFSSFISFFSSTLSSSFTGIRDSRSWEFRVVTFGIRAEVRNTLTLVGFTH